MTDGRAVTTVAIADDHALVRDGLRLILEREPDLEVVAEAGDVSETRRLLPVHRPDVLLLDLNMPGESPLAAIPDLIASDGPRVIVLTMQEDPAFARRALQNGAAGYVLKESAGSELVHAVRVVAGGDSYLTPRLGALLAAGPPAPPGPPDDLSDREVEVLRLLALGHTNKQVAARLYLSVRTVESHRARIQQKIGRSTRDQLVDYVRRHRLL